MDDVSEKNFKVLQEAFNHMDRRLNTQQQEIRALENSVATMRVQMQEAVQHLQVLRVITGGTGPTERS